MSEAEPASNVISLSTCGAAILLIVYSGVISAGLSEEAIVLVRTSIPLFMLLGVLSFAIALLNRLWPIAAFNFASIYILNYILTNVASKTT